MNALPLLSPDWYRVAHMRPRLRAGVRVSRQTVRGETWHVLTDPISGRHHRFNDIAYGLIGSCDGIASIGAIWGARVAALGDDAPSQAEAIRVIAQAFAANLFVGDIAPDALAIVRAQQREQGRRRRARLNPLALRVPLWDPDRFLCEHLHRVAWLFGTPARWGIGALLALGALLLLVNAGAVGDFARRELGGTSSNGRMLLTPVPYVDASASAAFGDKRARIVVAAAGIVVEALLASLALGAWLLLEPGMLRDLAFAVVFVGALSTLAVNGNPLLRFDGYHVLCDALELPNLAQRSARYGLYLIKRYGLGLRRTPFGALARGERLWLIAYAPLAWLFRAVLLALLAVLVAQWHAAAGIVVLLLALWMLALKPAWAALRWLAGARELHGQRPRAALAMGVAVAALGALAFALPLPQRTHAHGVVWLPDDATARLASDGFVEAFFVADGELVAAGTPLARLTNEPLQVELQRVRSQFERQQVERALQFEADARRAADADDELQRLGAELERLQRRVDGLTVRAGVAGRAVIDTERVRVGQYLAQGEVVAQVLPPGAPLVRTLVRNEDIALVRERPGQISVQLAHEPTLQRALPDSAVPLASTQLPTRALGEAAGGSIALDSTDASGLTAREPHFRLDVRLPEGSGAHVGERALVTFRHGEASAADLVARFVRQSLLRHFTK